MLGKVIEEVVNLVAEIKNEGDNDTPNVIFLDKSARPLSIIFREIWSLKYPNKERPHTNFLNLGRELLKESKYFQMTPEIKKEIERIKEEYIYLKKAKFGSKVVVIDDIYCSGTTEKIALEILSNAFPNLKFEYRFLVKAMAFAIKPKDYDKNNPQLFDLQLFDLVGEALCGGASIYTAPPWKYFRWMGMGP